MSGGRDSRSDVRVGGKKNDESAPGLETEVVLDCDLDLRNSSRKVWLVRSNVVQPFASVSLASLASLARVAHGAHPHASPVVVSHVIACMH
jgi:hypothetical protein